MYCAIIGDLVSSKKLTDRQEAQVSIKRVLDYLNQKFSDDLASKFTITLGDEFQGLLKTPQNLINILEYIKKESGNLNMRFGIGIGDITTEINPQLSIGADGPAYNFARNAIEIIKKSEKMKEQPAMNTFISVAEEDTPPNLKNEKTDMVSAVNAVFSQNYFIRSRWTDKQKNVIENINQGISQSDIANTLKVNQSVIARMLKSSGYYTYSNAIKTAQQLVNHLWERLEHD